MSNYIGNVSGGSSGTVVSPQQVTASSSPPASPSLGDIWHDTDDGVTYARIDVGGGSHVWLDISSSSGQRPKMTSAASQPTDPILGDFWLDTDDSRIYIYTNDGTSNVWVDIAS